MNPSKSSTFLSLVWPLIFLGVAATQAYGQESGISFLRDDWSVTCDNTLTCRMEGYSSEDDDSSEDNGSRGGVLITRSAGPNAPLHGAVTLADYDDGKSVPWPAVLKLMVNGKEKGQLEYSGKGSDTSDTYLLTQAQVLILLVAAKNDDRIEFKGENKSFVLSGKGVSAVMLKMDDVQGRIGTPGALIRKGKKPETSVHSPVPMPVIQAAKTIEKPVSRELTASEAKAIEPMLWKTQGEICPLHKTDRKDDSKNPTFTLTPVDDQYALISTSCSMGAYQGTTAFWLADRQGKKVTRFLLADIDPYYDHEKGIITSSGKGRGLGDCWEGSSWTWDGTDFRHSSEWSTGRCRLIHAGGTWHGENSILTYATKVIPSK